MSEAWERYYLNDDMLKATCESPVTLRLPVGFCVNVRVGKGVKVNDKYYRAIPSYILESQIEWVKELCEGLSGWELYVSAEPLSEHEWRRGWVDEYYPLSSKPVFKCTLPGMYKVELRLVNVDLALLSLGLTTNFPVCPTCTLEQYEDESTRRVFDTAMSYFIHYWLYGSSYDKEDRGEDV